MIVDRTFVVSLSGINEADRGQLLLSGIKLTNCQNGKCKAQFHVSPGATPAVPIEPLRRAYAPNGSGTTVNISVAFFDDESELTNSTGYFTLVTGAAFSEPGSPTTWTVTPDSAGRLIPISACWSPKPESRLRSGGTPRDGDNRFHGGATATLVVNQGLGTRADAEIELTAKSGDLGDPAGEPTVKASRYRLNLYSLKGLSVTGGRYDVAAPSYSIAAQESGDAIGTTFRIGGGSAFGKAAWIFKNETTASKLTLPVFNKAVEDKDLDGDHYALVAELRDIWVPGVSNGGPTRNASRTKTPPIRCSG